MNDRIDRLEEKIAYLERHVTEQDKAMLDMSAEIGALRREFTRLRDRATKAGDDDPADERPPHY